ncbi:MAG: aminoacyl-tRNA hydrolase [Acidobacteria bacterium]|nr:MAG: aminoacyl-tRNA hydrolase [Acidobacteriota bacterium]
MPASPDPDAPYLVVGLGNPGAEYEATPHNFGFMVVDELARRAGVRLRTRECQALTARGQLQGKPVWLAQPLTYMNLSGDAIAQLIGKEAVADLLVVCDELDLPFGTLRLRERGSAGSHNGLRSVVARLGTTEFARLRLGIDPGHPIADRVEFVLHRWSKAQTQEALQTAATAADVVELVLKDGIAAAMTRYNVKQRETE